MRYRTPTTLSILCVLLAANAVVAPPLFTLTTLTVSTAGDAAPTTGGSGSSTSGDLRYCMNYISQNAADTYTIQFGLTAGNETVTLGGMLPILNLLNARTDTITIDGANTAGSGSGTKIVVDGNNLYNGFFARQGTVNIQNITIKQGLAIGGTGGPGGGGAMGAGGAIFSDSATISLSNVWIDTCKAQGGNGGPDAGSGLGGGGGMLGGTGGGWNTLVSPVGASGGGGGLGGSGGGVCGPGSCAGRRGWRGDWSRRNRGAGRRCEWQRGECWRGIWCQRGGS